MISLELHCYTGNANKKNATMLYSSETLNRGCHRAFFAQEHAAIPVLFLLFSPTPNLRDPMRLLLDVLGMSGNTLSMVSE